MSKSKSCDKCGYLGDDKYDDFFEYQKDGEKITTCYFCIEMTATCEKNIKKNEAVTYQMLCQGMYCPLR